MVAKKQTVPHGFSLGQRQSPHSKTARKAKATDAKLHMKPIAKERRQSLARTSTIKRPWDKRALSNIREGGDIGL